MLYAGVRALSNAVARVEVLAVMLLIGLIPILIVLNMIFRVFNHPIYWGDEASILAMVWLSLIGTSLSFKKREAITVDLLNEIISSKILSLIFLTVSDVMVVIFGVTMVVICYIWFDPVKLYSLGFNFTRFSEASFNFVYVERTQTLSVAKFWVWLILPAIGASITLHGVSNLIGNFHDTDNGAKKVGATSEDFTTQEGVAR